MCHAQDPYLQICHASYSNVSCTWSRFVNVSYIIFKFTNVLCTTSRCANVLCSRSTFWKICHVLNPYLQMCFAFNPNLQNVLCTTRDAMTRQVSGLDGVVTGGGICVHQHAFGKHGFWSTMHILRPLHTEVIGTFLLLQDLGFGERSSGLHGQLSHSHPALQRACYPSPVRVSVKQ